ncbi:MAG: hypothetical protein IKJ41_12250 [Clostridia bacterium]|nr:hypothetical protein [Clostridia bacterium]
MLFGLFERKKKYSEIAELSEDAKQWNKMWDMWSDGEVVSPYNELMNYQSEVNNGGHAQYFINTENVSNLTDEISTLNNILPGVLKENLKNAYQAHLLLKDGETNDAAEADIKKCDAVFFANEEMINDILNNYCKEL